MPTTASPAAHSKARSTVDSSATVGRSPSSAAQAAAATPPPWRRRLAIALSRSVTTPPR
ncbi:hypothetical protein [Longispora fulva]|uniref:Uncharacterized protein n=1 Tax=Longispora fulva TaxID=619741 RepID=A0A8J7KN07_9ACTN|nr:hypothetical protein [Longispora fulva]MBG6134652.1 hypothetical protein [Longispora fulva]